MLEAAGYILSARLRPLQLQHLQVEDWSVQITPSHTRAAEYSRRCRDHGKHNVAMKSERTSSHVMKVMEGADWKCSVCGYTIEAAGLHKTSLQHQVRQHKRLHGIKPCGYKDLGSTSQRNSEKCRKNQNLAVRHTRLRRVELFEATGVRGGCKPAVWCP